MALPTKEPDSLFADLDLSDPTRTRILYAARETFDRHGILRVTMEEIARDLGISKKTLYKHFSNKEELVRVVVQLFLKESAERMDALLAEPHENFIERLQRVMEVLGAQAASVSHVFIRELATSMPGLWKEVEGFRAQRLAMFGSVLEQGRLEGFIRDDVDIDLIVMIFMTLIQSLVNPHSLARSRYSFPQMVDGIMTLIFEGMLTKEARKRVTIAGRINKEAPHASTMVLMSSLPLDAPPAPKRSATTTKAKRSR